MKFRPAVAVLVLATVSASCQRNPSENGASQNAREAILAQERQALDRYASGDPLGYAYGAAEDVTYFDHTGAGIRIDGLEAWRRYLDTLQIPPHRYDLVDPEVQLYGDIGILTFHWVLLGPDGTPSGRWKATAVYRLEKGTWRKVHAHWSEVTGE